MGSSVILPTPGQPKQGPDPNFSSPPRYQYVNFKFKEVDPPSAVYVQRDDVFLIRCFNSQANQVLRLNYRMLLPVSPQGGQPDHIPPGATVEGLLPGGVIIRGQQLFNVDATRTANTFQLNLVEGYLLGLVFDSATAGAITGQVYVDCTLFNGPIVGGLNAQELCGGYISGYMHLAWPSVYTRSPGEGPGWLHSVQVANPAAGADWTFTVPAQTRMRPISFSARFVASATVANRTPQLIVQDAAANVVWQTSIGAAITAGTTNVISATTTNAPTGSVATTQNLVLPPAGILPAGFQILTVTAGIQAGDQWSAIWIFLEEWLGI